MSYFLCSMWKQISPFYKHKSLLSSFCSRLPCCSSVSSDSFAYPTEFLSSIRHQSAHFSGLKYLGTTSLSDEHGKRERLEVEIISAEHIKPAVPTPDHCKLYKLSLLDQIYPNTYTPFVYFYKNIDQHQHSDLINRKLVSRRRHVLKQSLSETLTKFYPLAGKISANDQFIDCNDEGVYYVEARVNDRLFDFLKKPNNKLVHQLLPFDPSSKELWSKTYVTMIQATVFGCGGLAIGIYNSHKIIDAYSYATLMNAWAATARGCSQLICPNFVSSSIFLPKYPVQRPEGAEEASCLLSPQQRDKTVTKRFVFSASSLMALKRKASAPSRVMAIASLVWKCFMTAKSRSSSHSSKTKPYTVYLAVNLRARSRPPLPPYSIGNIILAALTQYKANNRTKVELGTLTGLLKHAVDGINSQFVEKMKGEEGYLHVEEYKNEIKEVLCGDIADSLSVASLCNSGMYETDFGWGKPVWISYGNAGVDNPLVENEVCLMDTGGGGIEAWVTLTEKDMAVFESEVELLDFASLDPSPLGEHHA